MEKPFYLSMQFIHQDKIKNISSFSLYSKLTFPFHEPLNLISSFQTYTHMKKFSLTHLNGTTEFKRAIIVSLG